MMLTQPMSVLAHDLAAHCRVADISQVEDRQKSAGKRRPPSHTPMEDTEDKISFSEGRRLYDHYLQGSSIGNGGFGSVYAGTCKQTGKSVAIKSISKQKVFGWSMIGSIVVPKEVALLHCLKQKYIIKMLDYFEENDKFYIIMERPEKYIDLFDYITEKGTVSERSSKYLFQQVLEAVQYCLSMGVVHRDVKDENILIDLSSNQVKLIDFGSGTFLQDEVYTEYEGTSVYCPPEWVLERSYHAVPATVWSLGILLYDMLLGDVPFENESEIVTAHLNFHINISKDAESLIRWMLSVPPHKRPTMDQVFNHPWMKSSSSSAKCSVKSTSANSSGSSLGLFNASNCYTFSQSQPQHSRSPLKYQFCSSRSSQRNHVLKSSSHRPAPQSPRPVTVCNAGRGKGFTSPSSQPASSSYNSPMQTRSQARLNKEKYSQVSIPSANADAVNWAGRDTNKRSPCQYSSQYSSSHSGYGACKGPAGHSGSSLAGSSSPMTTTTGIQVKSRKNLILHPKAK